MPIDQKSPIKILIFNPNSSQSITDGLQNSLVALTENNVQLTFLTGPKSSPESINDAITSIQSAHECFQMVKSQYNSCSDFDAILVCCFSDHPLSSMLRLAQPKLSIMHILDSGILSALLMSQGKPFGILTTGFQWVPELNSAVGKVLGSNSKSNDRYIGCYATGLGVLQLRDPNQKEFVEKTIIEYSSQMAKQGIGAVILGCAGFTGMESIVRKGLAVGLNGDVEAARQIAIIDSAKAGLELLTAQVRMNKQMY